MNDTTGALPKRAHELEGLLGDPQDPSNPYGFGAILEADERAETFAEGERLLDMYGLGAEFVPTRVGGRLDRLDHLVEIMRSVTRRDPSLALGYGASSLIAGVNVWTAGCPEQQRAVADLLLRNRKVACAFHELAHGNDMARTEFDARPTPDGFLLNGTKEVITNIERADALVILARTGADHGSRSHSQILVEKGAVPPDRIHYLPRYTSVGMRGVQLGGVRFADCHVASADVLGPVGHGLETALRALQVTRVALPAMATGQLDTGLRTTLSYVLARGLYGVTAADIPHVRSELVDTFVDLQICECFALVAARAVHLLPAETSVYASAVKYFVSRLLLDAMNRLAVVLGSRFYLREGEQAIFQKLLRDTQPAGFAHIARAICQMSLLPQLPQLARRSWLQPAASEAPPELFDVEAALPPLAFDPLTISARGRDQLSACLGDPRINADDPETREVREHLAFFRAELGNLGAVCASLPPTELTATASPAAYDLVSRYVTILAASACFGFRRHSRDVGAAFVGEPGWMLAVLIRLRARLEGTHAYLTGDLERRWLTELLERHEGARSLGLYGRPISG